METLDLHPIFRNERAIATSVREALFRCAAAGVDALEIIPGKGSGTLKRRVLAMLGQAHLRKLYRSVESDPGNEGRIVVRFK